MKLTNKHNLPQSVYNLLAKDRYSGNASTDYSVTTLLSTPRIVQLKKRHDSELEEDAMDNVWSLFGHVAHALLEEHSESSALCEERISVKLLDRNISGQVDSYHDGIITDYKVTSAWTLVYGSRIHEWTEQLNSYSFLFQQAEYEVKELRICAILRDWDKNKAKFDSNYPQTPIVIIPIELWSFDRAERFILNRVRQHIQAEGLVDDQLPECSESDMWCQPIKYAVMKEGGKRALRVFDTKDEAYSYIGMQPVKDAKLMSVVVRQGKRTRCEEYCAVNGFCSQYQEYLRSLENA